MKLLYIPPLGGGIRDLFQAGQHRRLLEDYCQSWLTAFDEVVILSFFDESLDDYPGIRLDPRIRLLANRHQLHRYVYSAMAPFLFRKELSDVSVVRVSQTTGALPALGVEALRKLLGRSVPVAMTYGYDYVQFASIRGQKALAMAKMHEWLGRVASPQWITTTEDLKAHLMRDQGIEEKRISLIPNGVPLDKFAPKSQENTVLNKLVFVGRMEAQKDLPNLVKLLSRACDKLSLNLELRMIGEGSLRNEITSTPKSDRLNLQLGGNIEHAQLPQALSEAQLFVTNTLFEGHPKAVIEAMAVGLPILGRDSPGLGNLLRASGQQCFTSENEFIEGLQYFLDFENRKLTSKRASDYVRDHFSLESTLKMETDLLRRLALGQMP